jgi:hypothetical protein
MNISLEILKNSPQLILKKFAEGLNLNTLFEPGKPVNAIVKQTMPNNMAKLQIGNQEVIAKTMTPLKAGENLTVKNIGEPDKPLLKIIQSEQTENGNQPTQASAFKKQFHGFVATFKNNSRGFPYNRLAKLISKLPAFPPDAEPLKNIPNNLKSGKTEIEFSQKKNTDGNKSQIAALKKTVLNVKQSEEITSKNKEISSNNSAQTKGSTVISPDAKASAQTSFSVKQFGQKILQFKNHIETMSVHDSEKTGMHQYNSQNRNLTINPDMNPDIKLVQKINTLLTAIKPIKDDEVAGEHSTIKKEVPKQQIKAPILTGNHTKKTGIDSVKTALGEFLKETPAVLKKNTYINNIVKSIARDIFTQTFPEITMKADIFDKSIIQSTINRNNAVITEHETETHLKQIITKFALHLDKIDFLALRDSINANGLSWENKLKRFFTQMPQDNSVVKNDLKKLFVNDIKALSMMADFFTSKGTGEDKHNRISSFKEFAEALEKFQIINSNASEESGKYLIPLPFFSGNELKFGELFVDNGDPENKKQGNKNIRVAFILELSALGDVVADFSVYNKSISGFFGVKGVEEKKTLESMLPAFKKKISQLGFNIKKIDCTVVPKNELKKKTFFDTMVNGSENTLNIVI